MSYDLAVWRAPGPVTKKDVEKRYIAYCDGLPDHSDAKRVQEISSFFAELESRYPTISEYPLDRLSECPWNSRFDIAPDFGIVTIAWSRVSEVVPFVLPLASRHRLICYDPQSDTVFFPD
jgi:hypothetical protein